MRFWDSSALVPLLIPEDQTTRIEDAYREDSTIVVWCLTPSEAWSAIARKRRSGQLGSPEVRVARQRLQRLESSWAEVEDFRTVRSRAQRLLEVHPLRAVDALQLAAALVAVADRPDGYPFLTLDNRLADAAELEGFDVGFIGQD